MDAISRRRITSASIALVLIPVGIVWRMAPLHLPVFLWKYGGSALWAAMVYWIVAALAPSFRPRSVALVACLLALLVELSRLVHTPVLDAFRMTLAGKLILGKFFSLRNIVAYWFAIAATARLDRS